MMEDWNGFIDYLGGCMFNYFINGDGGSASIPNGDGVDSIPGFIDDLPLP